MSERVQVILEPEDKARLQRQARSEKTSLSSWIRRAALERLAALTASKRFTSGAELRAFFDQCDRREQGTEPDWEQHLEVIQRSLRTGDSGS